MHITGSALKTARLPAVVRRADVLGSPLPGAGSASMLCTFNSNPAEKEHTSNQTGSGPIANKLLLLTRYKGETGLYRTLRTTLSGEIQEQ